MEYNEKQVQIIEAAEHLFATKGFEGASVRDIAEAAGVNIAMISYYFGSKEKLMEALFEERTSHVRLRVEALLKDNSLEPFQKVEALVDDYVERILGSQQFHKIIVCEQVINKNPVILKAVLQLKKKNMEVIGKLIKDGQQKGVFKKKVDVSLMMATMFGTMTQSIIGQDYYREINGLESLSEKEFQQLLKKKLLAHIKLLFKAILIEI